MPTAPLRALSQQQVFSHGSVSSDTKEGRLMALVQEFRQSLSKWMAQVEMYCSAYRKSGYWRPEDTASLESIQFRTRRFMHNVEANFVEASLSTSTVGEGGRLERNILKMAADAWDEAHGFVSEVERLLHAIPARCSNAETSSRRVAPEVPSVTMPTARDLHKQLPSTPRHPARVLSQSPPTATTSVAAANLTTPSRRPLHFDASVRTMPSPAAPDGNNRLATPTVVSRQTTTVSLPHGATTVRGSPSASVSPAAATPSLSLSQRKEVLETLQAIKACATIQGVLNNADLELAKCSFATLYGRGDGHRRFQNWLDEITKQIMRRGPLPNSPLSTSF